MAKNKKSRKQDSANLGVAAAVIGGTVAALIGLFAFGRRARDGDAGPAGAIDRALGMPSGAAADGGDSATDLDLDQPHKGPGDRAAKDFRPDATAPIPASKRDAFAPATMPNPNAAEPAM